MDRSSAVPLHLTSLVILGPHNAPLYVHAFTGEVDTMRAYHLAHAAVDVIEERIVMTSSPNRPADSYLGLLFCMEDMAFYGFQTTTKLRMVLSVALVDAPIKDADIVAIFRAVHHLFLEAVNNPFLSLPPTFTAKHAIDLPIGQGAAEAEGAKQPATDVQEAERAVSGLKLRNEPTPEETMFGAGPEEIKPEWLAESRKFTQGIAQLGELLCGAK